MIKDIVATLSFLFLIGCSPQQQTWDTIHSTGVKLPGVVALVHVSPSGKYGAKCTGVLVKPNAVITAAHCIDEPKLDIDVIYRCTDIHDDACQRARVVGKKRIDVYDIGLVVLKKNIGHGVGVVELAKGLPRLDEYVTAAGFGLSGHLRYGTVPIWTRGKHSYVTDCTNDTGFRPEPGDSGGPSYISQETEPLLSGIATEMFIVSYKSIFFVGTVYEDVSMHRQWIDDTYDELYTNQADDN
jgi:V8-like Glu-specific endopeptidase